jgi:2-dehydro-3-deoxyphosphogluconate aldolase/(4S)-4-hydroxy-2-oxoglutarate aldolase
MEKEEVRARIEEIGILPSVRVASRDLALFAAETVYAAGIPIVEITLTIPGALEVISDLSKRYPDLVVGAGTVLDEESARRCVDAGARFLTSPGLVRKVVSYAKLTNVAVLPGALTPTEVIAAWKAGGDSLCLPHILLATLESACRGQHRAGFKSDGNFNCAAMAGASTAT